MSDESKPNPQVTASRFVLAEHVNTTYVVTVEGGLTKAQIIHPDFWGHVAAKLRPYDEIKVRCDDGSFYAQLLVLSAERTFARVRVLAWHDLTTADVAKTQAESAEKPSVTPAGPTDYEVRQRGPHLKWCVVRLSDSQVLREKEPTKRDAEKWLDDYLKVTA